MSNNKSQTVLCEWCSAWCPPNQEGRPKTHYPQHNPRKDANSQPWYCPGGDG